jgi:ABC-type multidrug transport system fused ATPase/permease subunit
MLLVNVLPFALSLILLALFKPFHVVIFYFVALAAIGSFLMGIPIILIKGVVIYLVPSVAFRFIKQYANILIGCGAALIVLFLSYVLFRWWTKAKRKKKNSSVHPATESLLPQKSSNIAIGQDKNDQHIQVIEQDEEDYDDSQKNLRSVESATKEKLYERPPWYILAKNGLISVVLLYLGVLFVPLPTPGTPNWINLSDKYKGLGYTFLILGSMIGTHFLLSLFKSGRKILFKSGRWFAGNVGAVILYLMTALYIPFSNSIFQIFACNQETCSSGYELIKNYELPTDLSNLNTIITLTRYCRNSANI